MRVALVDPSLFTLPYDAALARGLVSAGNAVTLHGRRPGAEDGDAAGVAIAGDFYRASDNAAVRAMPGPVRLGLKAVDHMWSMTRLLRRLRRDKPDVIHFQWLALPMTDGLMLNALRRVAPLVLTVHDSNPFNGDPSSRLQQHGFARCLRAFDRLIVHTAQGRARLEAMGVAGQRITEMPHGLLGAPADDAPDSMQGTLTLLLFGKIKPYKGADLLIEAFARLPAALRATARIRVVGKPYMDTAPLLALAEARGIAGQVGIEPRFVADDEVPVLFGPSIIAVFPYREIEASGVLSLALAHGRPIVASDLGSFAETLTDGVHGHLVPAGDVAALAGALTHMLSDRLFAASCARCVRAHAADIPNWTDIARRTAEIYAAAAGPPVQSGVSFTADHALAHF